jgi:hypothetical protein
MFSKNRQVHTEISRVTCNNHRIPLDIKEQLHLAGEFVTNLPVPICLIDKKGFLHYTNPEFDNLISIQLPDEHFPYIGRFFKSSTFRQCLEELSSSPSVMQLKLRICWAESLVMDAEALTLYEWILSGSSLSEAVVNKIERKGSIIGDVDQESLINMEKYKQRLALRELKSKEEQSNLLLREQTNQNWNTFMMRVKPKAEFSSQMREIGEVMNTIQGEQIYSESTKSINLSSDHE